MIRRIFNIINLVAKHVGYVYMFHYVNRDTGENLTKIGISNNPRRRFGAVKSQLPGRLIYQGAFPVISPTIVEKTLHKKYADVKQRPVGAGPGAGSHEFFALSLVQSWLVTLNLWVRGSFMFTLIIINLIGWSIGPVKIAAFLTSLSTIVNNTP